jgi:hypothetical protein
MALAWAVPILFDRRLVDHCGLSTNLALERLTATSLFSTAPDGAARASVTLAATRNS